MFQISRLYCRRRSYHTPATYIDIIMGAILVAGISMLIYMRQRKTTEEQDKILKHIENWE
ncbi:MAG TPA: hypothetical protein VHJ38_11530 [Nitrososphaeraceae archaeon]|nr:hypothetical protein [Nitrososphaeraceae archaeon]